MNKSPVILRDVAQIASVPDANRTAFLRLIASCHQRRAQETTPGKVGKNISAGALTKDFFNPVVRVSQKHLRIGLERLQGENLAAGEAARSMAASDVFSEALQPLSQSEDAADPIVHLLRSLNLIIEAAERASERAKRWLPKAGRKKGTGSAGSIRS